MMDTMEYIKTEISKGRGQKATVSLQMGRKYLQPK